MASAIVARTRLEGLEYLVHHHGRLDWALAEDDAERFDSLREATRTAMRLPGRLRAFALPVSELH
jgi:hypothetical protein